ncbi:MAG: hypothetical protein IK013_01425 [Bacteroidales bacterium]|nr:hypothetical protein [Bacteroidales bacterium]
MTNGKIMKKKEKQRIGRRKRLAPNNVDFQPIRNKTVHSTFLFGASNIRFFFKQRAGE